MTMTASMGEIIYALGVGLGVGFMLGMYAASIIIDICKRKGGAE